MYPTCVSSKLCEFILQLTSCVFMKNFRFHSPALHVFDKKKCHFIALSAVPRQLKEFRCLPVRHHFEFPVVLLLQDLNFWTTLRDLEFWKLVTSTNSRLTSMTSTTPMTSTNSRGDLNDLNNDLNDVNDFIGISALIHQLR